MTFCIKIDIANNKGLVILRVLDEEVELHFKEVLEQHGIEINSLRFKAFIC